MPYTFISHTADIGFRVWGKTLEELFTSAAQALIEAMIEVGRARPTTKISVKLRAPNLEGLLVQWLQELIYLFETKNFLALQFKIKKCDPNDFEAVVEGLDWDEGRELLKTQIKAVTYHGLEIKKTKEGYETQVILDV